MGEELVEDVIVILLKHSGRILLLIPYQQRAIQFSYPLDSRVSDLWFRIN